MPGVSPQEVWEVEPILRRVIAARVADRSAVDDLVQDALERLLRARGRLDQEMMVPYGVVTARNLAASYGRVSARRSELASRMVDVSEPEEPDEVVLRNEERAAMAAALAHLSEQDRAGLLAREVDQMPVEALTPVGNSVGTSRVRLARSRAKLRVEYLLALRGVELPTAKCRPTLLALAGGDRARQQTAVTGRHLLQCETCASLSEPLVGRRRSLAVLIPLVAIRRVGHLTKSHPLSSGLAAAGAAGAVAVGVVVGTAGSPAANPPFSVPTVPATTAAVSPTSARSAATLTVDGRALPDSGAPLSSLVGHLVVARGAVVVAVVTHNGFWVASAPRLECGWSWLGPFGPCG